MNCIYFFFLNFFLINASGLVIGQVKVIIFLLCFYLKRILIKQGNIFVLMSTKMAYQKLEAPCCGKDEKVKQETEMRTNV